MTLPPAAVRGLFGRGDAPPDSAPIEPPVHPYRALLEAVNARSFESLAECAARRVECGMPHGAVHTVLDTYRNPVGVRVRRYRSDVEAEVDRRVVALGDALEAERDAAERERLAGRLEVAKRYQALAGLWDLENRLAAVPAAPAPRNAPAAPESASAALSREPSQATAGGFEASFDGTVRGLNAQRAALQVDRRASAIEQFDLRQEQARRGLEVPSTDDDDAAQRVRLETRRREWETEHPTLVEELSRYG